MAVEKAAGISEVACEEEPEISIFKTQELLSKAQQLMREIEELMAKCMSTVPTNQRRRRMIQQECEASIEEDGETLVIDGFRFESAASREELRRLNAEAGPRGGRSST